MDEFGAIAVVGKGAVMPDALDADAFWKNIVEKKYSIREVPRDRWLAEDYFDPNPRAKDKTYSKIGAFVTGFEFNWKRFKIPPKVAEAMDPAQQWAVEAVSQALTDYGFPERSLDLKNTGVILGAAMGGDMHLENHLRISFPEYRRLLESLPEFMQLPEETRNGLITSWYSKVDHRFKAITEDSMPGELPNVISGRIANVFDMRGTNFTIDAACASSLGALAAASEMLLSGRCSAVVTGGVDHNMSASTFVKFCKVGALSGKGSRPFGKGADGFVMGEGCAVLLLKRLEDAIASGDKVYAVIRGIGSSGDGKGKGITAPNPNGQRLAIERAWKTAGLDPLTTGLVEAHGTSTAVGDMVEAQVLNDIFSGTKPGMIALGSVKSNIGHLKAAAGAAGLLKAVMAIDKKVFPPTLHSDPPNPGIDFSKSSFRLSRELDEWNTHGNTPRRAGVSAYGFGGTNFHVILEEFTGRLNGKIKGINGGGSIKAGRTEFGHARNNSGEKPVVSGIEGESGQRITGSYGIDPGDGNVRSRSYLLSGIIAFQANTKSELFEMLEQALEDPSLAVEKHGLNDFIRLSGKERLVIEHNGQKELTKKLKLVKTAISKDDKATWNALKGQGIFRSNNDTDTKLAFLYPGQGSQYLNMGRKLIESEPAAAKVFAEADKIMTPILNQPLTSYLFLDPKDEAGKKKAEMALMDTAITQPAVLALDIALTRVLEEKGFIPQVVMGHSLGEYAALVAAGVLPFAHALEAAAARGKEMADVKVEDKGRMAAVFASKRDVEKILKQVDGYVIIANLNSSNQFVIGGATKAIEDASARFQRLGIRVVQLPVSHAFHTRIVEPAAIPLRRVLDRLDFRPPGIPLISNVTGEPYPNDVQGIKDLLQKQISSPVQWIKSLKTLHRMNTGIFLEVGPKKALSAFTEDVLANESGILSTFTNHPKLGDIKSLRQAICGLLAAGKGKHLQKENAVSLDVFRQETGKKEVNEMKNRFKTFSKPIGSSNEHVPYGFKNNDNRMVSFGMAGGTAWENDDQVVITGTGLGLPGAEKHIMDPDNVMRILRGEQFIDLLPHRFHEKMVAKRINRLVKDRDGNGSFQTISDPDSVIHLAGRPGKFDLTEEYGVSPDLVQAMDITTQLAMAAGLDALREAGIPLVREYKKTKTGSMLPSAWKLPEALRDETGIIFASAFPGYSNFADILERYHTYKTKVKWLEDLEDLRSRTSDPAALDEIYRHINALKDELRSKPFDFDRKFLLQVLSMGHTQFAEYIGARGPCTQVNAACASTPQAVSMAEDWIRAGRCRRVVVVAADNATGNQLMEWIGSGFLAIGAAATDYQVEDAALPFDKRRHGMIIGMGSCGLVLESAKAAAERGRTGIVQLLASTKRNSAYHATKLEVDHIADTLNELVTSVEQNYGLDRHFMAANTVFISHETYTPARGGSASAEVEAIKKTFGNDASKIVICNTKGYTGHPMAVGIEDVVGVKVLEHGIVPPVPNFKEKDPDLGDINLSRGGYYPVKYAIRVAAGFGSQVSITMTARLAGPPDRIVDRRKWQEWLAEVSGRETPEIEVEKRVLRIKDQGPPEHKAKQSSFKETFVNATGANPGRLQASMTIPVTPGIRMGAVQQAPQPGLEIRNISPAMAEAHDKPISLNTGDSASPENGWKQDTDDAAPNLARHSVQEEKVAQEPAKVMDENPVKEIQDQVLAIVAD
ncbi:MAG: acyltransferase domain-containing protein, partial [Deltaproteobacteria bacterium]|nr:acyltransferase domain-containing protein [Deltaproteobacteria bacterium]